MEQFVAILYYITIILKVPVIIGLMFTLVLSLYVFGGFLHELILRLSKRKARHEFLGEITSNNEVARDKLILQITDCNGFSSMIKNFFTNVSSFRIFDEIVFERVFMDIEFKTERRNIWLRIGIRLGPALGLMGTLIPMGSALMGLAKGNVQMMSNDLIIAFSTTVAGLFIGLLCYVILAVTNFWNARDMADIEFLKNIITKESNK